MLVKKSVLLARLQKAMAKLEAEKAAHELTFKSYQKEYVAYEKAVIAAAQSAKSYVEWDKVEWPTRPDRPALSYYHADNIKRIRRNMRLLEVLEGDVIEVEKLQAGRNYSLGDLLDSLLGE